MRACARSASERGPKRVKCCWRASSIYRCCMASSWWIALASSILLAGCGSAPLLPELGQTAPFTLTDQNGAPFDSRALENKIWIADFVFTHCPGPCPRMSSQMHQVQQALGKEERLRLVSFTVDPARDTPE